MLNKESFTKNHLPLIINIMNKFYELSAKTISWKEVSMNEYAWKVVVVVNTASKCGLIPQYEGLEALYKKYKNDGLVILWFPCNQFWNQESGDEKAIKEWSLLNDGVTFPIFSKIKVNGDNTHPLFAYLKKNLSWWFGSRVKWNFTKFVLDREWNPVKRFAPSAKPEDMEQFLLKYIKN